MFVRAYLRASVADQDANRAREQLEAFAAEYGLRIAGFYVESESAATLARPELFRLVADAKPGDILLIEQVDYLSRLSASDWEKLRTELASCRMRVVALDLPTSWIMVDAKADQFSTRMFDAMNSIMLDTLAAVARCEYEARLRRQAQGHTRARLEGRLKGRAEDVVRNAAIAAMIKRGMSWSQIQDATGCSRGTVAKIAARIRTGIREEDS